MSLVKKVLTWQPRGIEKFWRLKRKTSRQVVGHFGLVNITSGWNVPCQSEIKDMWNNVNGNDADFDHSNIIFFLYLLAVFIIFVLFCHQVVRFIQLVFRQTQELNSRPRTMAQTVSSRRSPLDHGASLTSLKAVLQKVIFSSRLSLIKSTYFNYLT